MNHFILAENVFVYTTDCFRGIPTAVRGTEVSARSNSRLHQTKLSKFSSQKNLQEKEDEACALLMRATSIRVKGHREDHPDPASTGDVLEIG